MRAFQIQIDLADANVITASGFDRTVVTEGPGRIELHTRLQVGEYEFFVWGRFYNLADESSLTAWLAQFDAKKPADWLGPVDGDFIILVVHAASRQAHLITDRNGQYGAYVHTSGPKLTIANSLLGMARTLGGAQLSDYGVYQLFTLKSNLDPYCVLEGVRVAGPGEAHTYGPGIQRVETYYRPVQFDADLLRTPAECVAALDESLDKVCRKRASGPGAPALMLSGGIDSAALLVYLSKIAPGEVRTFTYAVQGFPDNELTEARAAAAHLHSRHQEVLVSSEQLPDLFIENATQIDSSNYSATLGAALHQALEQPGMRYELFGGIDTRLHTPPVDTVREWGRRINRYLASPALAHEWVTGSQWPDYFLHRLLPRVSYREYMMKLFLGYQAPPPHLRGQDELVERMLDETPDFASDRDRGETFKKCISFSYRGQYTDDNRRHVSTYEDERISMHLPFCDHEFVRACNRIPYAIGARDVFTLRSGRRYVPFVDKFVMRELLKDSLPLDALYRRKGALDEVHCYFSVAAFRELIDAVLRQWLPELVEALSGIARALVVDIAERYAAAREFTASDTFVLRRVYVIAYLSALNQVCMNPTFDLAGALQELKECAASQPAS